MTDPNGAQSGDGSTGQGDGGEAGTGNNDPGAQGGATGQQGGDSGAQSGPETVSKTDYDKLLERMRAADARASKAENEFKTLKDKDLPELEKAKATAAEATARADAAEKALREERINNAFLTDNSHEWRNPASALRLLDRTKLDIDSDGNVTGMKDALAALAKSDDYLLKPKQGEQQEPPPPGTPPANNGGQGTRQTTQSAREARFPALRGRQRLGG